MSIPETVKRDCISRIRYEMDGCYTKLAIALPYDVACTLRDIAQEAMQSRAVDGWHADGHYCRKFAIDGIDGAYIQTLDKTTMLTFDEHRVLNIERLD